MRRFSVVAIVILALLGLAVYVFGPRFERQAGLDGEARAQAVSTGQLVPLERIGHSRWDHLLKKYVDQDGMVNYAAWKQSPADLAALDEYLLALGQGDPGAETSPQRQLAFWINAYNALTVQGILREYPTSSIRNHTAKVFGYNIWDDLLLAVGPKSYSLNAMEHKILRKLKEPRIHFSIVCASIGCPRLLGEAYTPEQLETQLAGNTRDFFSRRKHFRVDSGQRTLYVSAILKWFAEDFGRTVQEGLAGLADYMPDDATRRLIETGSFSVVYLDYDWGLNDQQSASKEP